MTPSFAPLLVPAEARYSLATSLRGIAAWLRSVSASSADLQDAIVRRIHDLEAAWTGASATLALGRLQTHAASASELAKATGTVATATDGLAGELAAVKLEMRAARADAVRAGLLVTFDAIHLTAMVFRPGTVVSDHARIADRVHAARAREARAHTAFRVAVNDYLTFLDYLLPSVPTTTAGVASRTLSGVRNSERYQLSAAARERAVQTAATIAQHADGPVRTEAYRELARRIPGVLADRAAGTLHTALSAHPYQLSNPRALRMIEGFNAGGGALTAVGVGLAITRGTPVDRALGVGVASWASGAAATGLTAQRSTRMDRPRCRRRGERGRRLRRRPSLGRHQGCRRQFLRLGRIMAGSRNLRTARALALLALAVAGLAVAAYVWLVRHGLLYGTDPVTAGGRPGRARHRPGLLAVVAASATPAAHDMRMTSKGPSTIRIA